MSKYHDNLLANHFGIKKTQELATPKNYWPILQANMKAYVKGCNIYVTSKVVKYNFYEDLQSLL